MADDDYAKAFHLLKPPCVELSQVALKFKARKTTGKDLVKSAEQLHQVLREVSKQKNALDPKLADYVFFPLSHIFRESKDVPDRAIELVLQCLQILISCGWRSKMSSALGKQFLVLLSFLAEGSAVDPNINAVNEEVSTAAFKCLTSVLDNWRPLGSETEVSDEVETIPALGHATTVVLDGLAGGPSVKVRLTALKALEALIAAMTNEEVLKNFFPGIVSTLSKTLSSDNRSKDVFQILEGSLDTLSKVLCKVISDDTTPKPVSATQNKTALIQRKDVKADPWREATSAQIKLALANVMPLRHHDRSEVQGALFELCASVVQRCRASLYQSTAMMIETLVILCSNEKATEADMRMQRIHAIFSNDSTLLEMLKSSVHDWTVALPRIMQSNDDTRKRRVIDQIATSFRIITAQGEDSDILNDALALHLRSSVSAAIQSSSSHGIRPVSNGNLEMTQMLGPAEARNSTMFSPILFGESSQKYTMSGLQTLAQQLKTMPITTKLVQGIVETLRTTSGEEQLSSLWLSLQLLDDPSPDIHEVDQYLNIQADTDQALDPLLEQVYSFSLDLLAEPTYEDSTPWRLQALALETLALQAGRQGQDFRPELVDALYPILERIGSSNTALQQHAMTCLNIISNACSYPSASALIIDNVDYLVNTVALKLNTFDISPQAPQVLVMMVQLCGPALIPYLDDLVDSIFSILACFHGYPRLVESLFSVLHAIVEEGAKAPLPAITPGPEIPHRRPPYQPTSIATLVARLASKKAAPPLDPLPHEPSEPSPSSPEDESPPPRPKSPEPPALSKPHTLLHLIAASTPQHLHSPSPRLTALILSLLPHTFHPLSRYPDTFFPLTTTLFPPFLSHLHSPHAHIAAAAAHAMTALCENAGEFLRSRIEDHWPAIVAVYKRAEREMLAERKYRGGKTRGAKWKTWDKVVGLVVAVVEWVGCSAEMEDDVFEMVGGWVGEREGLRGVLEGLNADALWLMEEGRMRRDGGGKTLKVPSFEGVMFRDVEF